MPTWLIQALVTIGCGLVLFLINRLTTKSASELAKEIELIKAALGNLREQGWTTDQKVTLAERLVKLEAANAEIKAELNFTKTSHQEFLRLLEKAFIPVAHSPHTPALDRLLEKKDRGEELSSDEWTDLLDSLGKQANEPNVSDGKRVALLGLQAIYLTSLRQAQEKEFRQSGQHLRHA